MKVKDALVEQRILDQARDLLLRRGLKGWNMDDLARASGLTKPTLYKIVSKKEKLIERVILDDIRSMLASMVEITEKERDYVEALSKILMEYPRFFENQHAD